MGLHVIPCKPSMGRHVAFEALIRHREPQIIFVETKTANVFLTCISNQQATSAILGSDPRMR